MFTCCILSANIPLRKTTMMPTVNGHDAGCSAVVCTTQARVLRKKQNAAEKNRVGELQADNYSLAANDAYNQGYEQNG